MVAVFAALAVRGVWIEPRQVEPVAVGLSCRGGVPIRVFLFSDVSFRGVGRREEAVLEAARRFDPDLVMVAGDFFDDRSVLEDAQLRREGARFLASIPARAGRLAVSGEMEMAHLDSLRSALAPDTSLLVNESRRVVVKDRCLEVFGSLEPRDAPVWSSGEERGRRFVASLHGRRKARHRLLYVGPESKGWAPRETTLLFQTVTEHAGVAIDLGGRIVERHDGRPDFQVAGRALQGRVESGFRPAVGIWYRARLRVDPGIDGTHIRARFWQEGSAEPTGWMIEAFDGSDRRGPEGTFALGGLGGESRYAHVEVTGAEGEPLLLEKFDHGWRARWDSGSALERWLGSTADSPCDRVVLAHNPDIVRQVRDLAPPVPCVVLAGHTHGGQVRLPWIGALYSSTWIGRRFDRGLFDYDGVPLYITAGVGTTIVPIRLFNLPEVTQLTLEP